MVKEKVIGIIGGSGLYEMEGVKDVKEVKVNTPYGSPSDAFIMGSLDGRRVAFLSRHGRGHRAMPSEINFRANIFGMKKLGVERIISVSACGSMKEEIKPGDIVLPDQFFDRTRQRPQTFFGKGIVVHIPFSEPICPVLMNTLYNSAIQAGATVHKGGTYICIEGPQFSTKAESNIFRLWGVDVIGMTSLPEARLAREAEICYSTLALATDYDCWHEKEAHVTIDIVLETMKKNVSMAKEIIRRAVLSIKDERTCPCATALKDSIITDRKKIPQKIKSELKPLIGRYI